MIKNDLITTASSVVFAQRHKAPLEVGTELCHKRIGENFIKSLIENNLTSNNALAITPSLVFPNNETEMNANSKKILTLARQILAQKKPDPDLLKSLK